MTSSCDKAADADSIEPAEEIQDVDISKEPTVLSWTGNDNTLQVLSHAAYTNDRLTFDLQFDAASHTAFFKILASVAFMSRRSKSNIYLLIPPESIQTLAIVDDDDNCVATAARLGTATYSLRFDLGTRPVLVLPKDDAAPKNDAARGKLEALQDLAGKKKFNVALPRRALSKDRLVAICAKASSSGCLKTIPDSFNIAKLYGGRGGVVYGDRQAGINEALSGKQPFTPAIGAAVQGLMSRSVATSSRAANQQHDTEHPPSYDELDSPPPSIPAKKRRRLESGDSMSSGEQKRLAEATFIQGFRELAQSMGQIAQALRDFGPRMDSVEQRLLSIEDLLVKEKTQGSGTNSSSAQGGRQWLNDLIHRLQGVEKRMDQVDVSFSELTRDVENQIYDIQHEFEDTIAVRVDDEMGVAQSQLEDFVKDELRNVAEEIDDTVREKLRDALS